jgi:hypothetical protein
VSIIFRRELKDGEKGIGLCFVRLLARPNKALNGFGSIVPLLLLKFVYPARNGRNHVGGRLTRTVARDARVWRFLLTTLFALNNFYVFLL